MHTCNLYKHSYIHSHHTHTQVNSEHTLAEREREKGKMNCMTQAATLLILVSIVIQHNKLLLPRTMASSQVTRDT